MRLPVCSQPVLIHFGVEALAAEWERAVVCVGTFDGVHLGHQQVIRTAVAAAKSEELPCVLVTFDRHPAATLAPERCPPALATLDENLDIFSQCGVSVAAILSFDRKLANTSAEQFLQHILVGKLKASWAVVGHDFAFGKDRVGTPAWLSDRLPTFVVPPFEIEGVRVSSRSIREMIAQGEVEHAAKLLGRWYGLGGVVVGGKRLGRELGYPTINLGRSMTTVLPADGVYAGVCETPHGVYRMAASIGLRPAVGGGERVAEAFLIDYPGHALYGASVRLLFEKRLREERDFPSLEALKEQMALDVRRAK